MKKRHMGLLLSSLSLIILSSCFIGSSLIFFESDTQGKQNLLNNPGFAGSALTTDILPEGWTVMNSELVMPESIKLDYSEAIEGDNSLRIDASEKGVMIVSDAFRVRRYGGYYIRVKARSTEPIGERIILRFITFTSAGKTLNRFKDKLRTTHEWKSATISAGFIDERASFGRVAIMIPPFTTGSVWIDAAGAWEVHYFRID